MWRMRRGVQYQSSLEHAPWSQAPTECCPPLRRGSDLPRMLGGLHLARPCGAPPRHDQATLPRLADGELPADDRSARSRASARRLLKTACCKGGWHGSSMCKLASTPCTWTIAQSNAHAQDSTRHAAVEQCQRLTVQQQNSYASSRRHTTTLQRRRRRRYIYIYIYIFYYSTSFVFESCNLHSKYVFNAGSTSGSHHNPPERWRRRSTPL